MERLQKVLAQAGIASRRAAEQIILAGRVRVDGKIVRELGTQVDPKTSRVEVDGNKIVAEKLVYIVLHKPRGVVCTLSDPEGRPTIRDLLKDAGARVVPVGRLDFHTSGALLCTNDGEFAQALAHPAKEVPKVYVAKVKGAVDDEALERFGERIVIDGRPTQPANVQRLRFEGDKTWLEITLREGRNRQVRRLGEATGFPVMRLARISHAGVTSEDLRPGQWRPLTVDELVDIKRDYGVPKKVRAPSFDPSAGRDPEGRGTEGRPTRGDERGAKRPKARQSRGGGGGAPSPEPSDAFSRAARSAPKRFGAERTEPSSFESGRRGVGRIDAPSPGPKRFDDKRSSSKRIDAPSPGPKRFDDKRSSSKRFDDSRSGPKRFDDSRSGPKRFDDSRSGPKRLGDARGPKRADDKRAEPTRRFEGKAVEARRAESKRFDDKRAEPKRFDDARGGPKRFGDKRAEPKRFGDKREPSAFERSRGKPSSRASAGRLEKPAAKPGADRAKSRDRREAPSRQGRAAPAKAKLDARASAPRRGTSR